MFLELIKRVRPPRAVFVNHPFGAPFGPPGDGASHDRVLRAALALLEASQESLVEIPATPGFEADDKGELCIRGGA